MTDNEPQLIDLDDHIIVDISKEELSSGSITSSNSSIDLKKKKASPLMNYSNDDIDFSFLSDEILPPVDDEEIVEVASHTWKIENFRDLSENKHTGPTFEAGGFKWRLLLFPRGNANNHLALYLEPQPPTHIVEGEEVPIDPKWYVCAQFTLIISNPKDPKNYVLSTSHQRFSKDATDWGFSNFVNVRYLWSTRKDNGPLAFDSKVNITAFVKVLKDPTGVLWHNFLDYDSKQVTGFVGFKNQGATCYLNSLLQSYFFTKIFRRAVYQLPTEDEVGTNSVPLALQKIFYQLQKSNEALDTLELTKSFGWDTGDAFTQHDVQELNRVLMDKLENRMKGTSVENVLNKTFVGKMKSYIKCVNVDYESSRIEDFWDIQLNVKGLSNLSESFQNYIEVELMNGENQYAAQEFGLQDAKKGVVFEEFPPVLHLQLKRFEYDFNYDTLVKINDRYEYPESIDLSPYLDHSDKSEPVSPCIYDLHGVLVHAGDIISGGHYYAMIKPDKTDNWFRFDDDKVWRVTKRQVFEENFGMDTIENEKLAKMTRTQYQSYQIRRHTSAYMLVYMKRDQLDVILQEVKDSEMPKHIIQEVDKELEERALALKDLEESHLYLTLNFYSHELFKNYEGFDLGADQRNIRNQENYKEKDYPTTVRALKASKFVDLFPELNKLFHIDSNKVNLWALQYRRNNTLRPALRIEDFEGLSVDEVYQKYFFKKYSKGSIWIEQPEVELSRVTKTEPSDDLATVGQNGDLVDSPKLLIFIKFFDPESQTLKGLTYAYVSEDENIGQLTPKLNTLLGFPPDQKLDIYEEINPSSIEKLNLNQSFYKSEISSGDILTVQKSLDSSSIDLDNQKIYPYYPTVDLFYLYLKTRVHVVVKKLSEPSEDDGLVEIDENDPNNDKEIDFLISTQSKYEVFAKIIGSKFNLDPEILRIFVNYGGQRTQLRTEMIISNIIPKVNYAVQPFFEFEVLKIPLRKLENMTLVKIHYLSQGYMRYQLYDFFVEKTGTIADIVDKLQAKVGFSDEEKANVLVWANSQSKFYQVLFESTEVQELEPGLDIYAGILAEEVEILKKYYLNPLPASGDDETSLLEPKPRLVPVIQFHKDPRRIHGISFVFPVYPTESLKDMKTRLQKRLGLGQKDFTNVSICTIDLDNPTPIYLENENDENTILAEELDEQDYIALDHPDRTTRQGGHISLGGGGISIK